MGSRAPQGGGSGQRTLLSRCLLGFILYLPLLVTVLQKKPCWSPLSPGSPQSRTWAPTAQRPPSVLGRGLGADDRQGCIRKSHILSVHHVPGVDSPPQGGAQSLRGAPLATPAPTAPPAGRGPGPRECHRLCGCLGTPPALQGPVTRCTQGTRSSCPGGRGEQREK